MGGKLKFRPDIEGLRGIAVLQVVLYHAGVPWLASGFVGVDVFFVLSGYLITRLLADEIRETGGVDLLRFYSRRIRRLLPAALLTILATVIASALLLPPIEQLSNAWTALAASTYWSNLLFGVQAGDYFGPDLGRDPLLHMWSLSVEEQFYLVWPILIIGAARMARLRSGWFPALLFALVLVSFGLNLQLTHEAPNWAFFGTHARAWEFGIGALAGLITRPLARGSTTIGVTVGWVGLVAVITAGALIPTHGAWPGWLALVPVLGAALALVAGVLAPRSGLQAILSVKPLQQLGKLSYSWYLWHWPALVLAEAARGPLPLWARLGVAAGALGVAALAHHAVENPVRHHPRLLRSTAATLVLLVALTSLGAGAAAAWRAIAFAAGGADQLRVVAARGDYTPLLADGCLLQPSQSQPAECWYGDPEGAFTVVLYGDSHAAHLFPALERVAHEHGWRVLAHTKNSCPPLAVPFRASNGLRPHPECDTWRHAVEAQLERLRPDVVLLGLWASSDQTVEAQWVPAFAALVERLEPLAGRVIYVLDNPEAPFDLPTCLASAVRRDWQHACSFELGDALNAHGWERKAVAAAGVETLDLRTVLCPEGICAPEVNGEIVYLDDDHFTASFSATLWRDLEAGLAR